MSSGLLRGSLSPESEFYPDEVDFSRSLQYDTDGTVCQELDVVAACEGTSNQDTYTGIFRPINATDCDGQFEEGFPIYKHAGRSLYLYPIGYYSDSYSLRDYRGLVRWRLASFHHVDDKSCRRTQANIYQVDFAANGQPYNYYPTFACFDENGSDMSGYQESRILIICKDNVVKAPEDPEVIFVVQKESSDAGLIAGIVVLLLLLLGFGFWYKRRSKQDDSGIDDNESKHMSQHGDNGEEENFINHSRVLTEDSPSSGEDKDDQDSLSDLDLDKPAKPRSSRGKAEDPPASPPKRRRSMSRSKSLRDVEGFVPQTILNLVGNIEKMMDKEGDNDNAKQTGFTEPKRTRSISNPFNNKSAPSRSASLEPDSANAFAGRGRSRSRSLERSNASNFAGSSRGLQNGPADGSMGHTEQDVDYEENSRGRSSSVERSKARDFAGKVRDGSIERAKNFVDFVGKVRRNSLERSKSEKFSEKPVKYATPVIPASEPSSGERAIGRVPPARSLSLEGSKANDFAMSKMPRDSTRGRSRSMERAKAADFAEKRKSNNSGSQKSDVTKEGRRGRSRGRSKSRPRDDRSLSLDRSKANDFAKKKRSSSIERSKANNFAAKPKERKPASSGKAKLGTTIAKQADGSVIVSARRQREDGAIVTTKTKYASAAAARKRGIDV